MPDPSPGDAHQWPSPALNQADFPARFRAEGGRAIFQVAVGSVFAGGGLIDLCYLIRLSPTLTALDNASIGFACLGLAWIGAACIAGTLRSCLVIFEDAVEQHDLLTTRRLPRRAIASKAYCWSGADGSDNINILTLFPTSKQTKPLKIQIVFERSAAWNAWMSTIPDGVPPAWQQTRADRIASTLARWVWVITAESIFALRRQPIPGLSYASDLIITATLAIAVAIPARLAMQWLVNRWGVRPDRRA